MKPERWKEVDKLFDAVLEIAPERRAAFLEEACAGDENLRKEVETLLASDNQARSFIEAPVSELGTELLAGKVPRLAAGEMIGPYEILSPLGKGGMGEVFRAKDTRLEREVAVKILAGSLSGDGAAMSRFAREAKALAALSHPNIIAIHDFGTDQGISYAVMELLRGQTLRDKLAASKIREKEALEIGAAIANGLTAAHLAGVIHRDLKPENIFLTANEGVKILDFGLARIAATESSQVETSAATITQSEVGVVMGTVPYMSPEQVRAEKVDARTDIFSFGAVLYEMISGERLFARKTSADTIAAILREKPPQLPASSELNQIVQHCLEKNPDQRFQTARDLASNLKSLQSGSAISLPVPRARRLLHSVWRAIGALVVLVLIASIYMFAFQDRPIHSIAVLPFENVKKDPNVEYLSDGITESIITNISSLPELRVMARGTVFTFKGREVDPRTAGRDLNVDAIVTGRVLQQGETLVIQANLVNVSDGTQLWGSEYNKQLADILALQQEISKEIVKSLKLKLTGKEKNTLSKLPTDNSEAYRLYLKGVHHWQKDSLEDYEKAREYFQQAIDLDPAYALAYRGIGSYYAALAQNGYRPQKEAWPKANAAMKQAGEIDRSVMITSTNAADYKFYYLWDWSGAVREYQEIEKNASLSWATRGNYSRLLLVLGQHEEAIRQAKKAIELDPLNKIFSLLVAQVLTAVGRYDEAIEAVNRTLELDSNYTVALFQLADIYARKGMYEDAISISKRAYQILGDDETADLFANAQGVSGYHQVTKILAEESLYQLLEQSKESYVSPLLIASLYSQLNQKNEAFQWLEKAYEERSALIVFLKVNDDWKNLRSDPRFDDLIKRIGLPRI